MTDPLEWLPALLRLENHAGDWQAYIDAVYRVFERDLIRETPKIEGRPVRYRWKDFGNDPPQNKASTFWHVVTEGGLDLDRTAGLRRCERIGWIRAIIDAASSGLAVTWSSTDRGEIRRLVALPDFSFLVVLADRGSYLLLITAYPVEQEHQRTRLRREYLNNVGRTKS